jgi:hypothetical protein
MKKNFYSTLLLVFAAITVNAQAPKFVLFEHFTQASCGPCAAQNPAFQNTILGNNPQTVRHIAYHTSWPGVDPMYNHNGPEVDSRVSFYGVSGVPDIYMLGNQKNGQPGAFSQNDVDAQFSSTSPIKLSVTQTDTGMARNVAVTVKSLSATTAGTYKLFVAVIEREIVYANAPGNNGEKEFPNVFRKMLPNINGETITLPAAGMESTFNFNFAEHAAWNAANIEVVAFVQNTDTKEVLNSGSSFDPILNTTVVLPVSVKKGTNAMVSNFVLTAGNSGSVAEDFHYAISTDAPANWSANFVANGNTYTTDATINVAAGATLPIDINVTPGATPAVAKYTIEITSVTNPSSPAVKVFVYVISGVTDLIISNTAGKGDGTGGSAKDWEGVYTAGLTHAGNTTFATSDQLFVSKGINADAFDGVGHIYYNVGWTFPGLTDELVASYSDFLDNGGNLFLSGQDIGWETMDPSGTGTVATKSFYTNYLNAAYVADGTTANNKLVANTDDGVFGAVAQGTISNFYGGTNFFPDQLNTTANSSAIFYYDVAKTKKAGVRSNVGNHKVVYIGAGVEMFGTTDLKNEVLKLTHDWFHGLISGVQYDEAMRNLSMGQNYPNPANSIATIELANIERNMTLQVVDLTGRVLMENAVEKGASTINVNVSELAPGMYMYRLTDGANVSAAKPMSVVR